MCKWFSARKGFGFITATDGTEIFVHQTDIEMDGFRTLTAGQPVSFTTIVGAGGKAKAAAVVPLAQLGRCRILSRMWESTVTLLAQ